MFVPALDLKAAYQELRESLNEVYARVMESGWYVLGEETNTFLRAGAQRGAAPDSCPGRRGVCQY